MPAIHQNYSILLDLNASNASELLTATTAAAAAPVSQELWNLGGALVQRAQEQNIPCGESLTSTKAMQKLRGTLGKGLGITFYCFTANTAVSKEG